MTWKQFYDGYLCWPDSTVSSRLSQISDLQNADTTEIVDWGFAFDYSSHGNIYVQDHRRDPALYSETKNSPETAWLPG